MFLTATRAEMDWQLAIEKNREALKRILVMLVAMIGATSGARGQLTLFPQKSALPQDKALAEKSKLSPALPRHLHRFVLRLLRPAEAAARRLIILAAHGLVVELAPPRRRKPKPQSIFVRAGAGTGIVRVGSLTHRTLAASRALSLPLFDPLKRFGRRRRCVKPSAVPRIRSFDDARVPLFQQPRQPDPPPLTPDDPLDAGRVFRRLEALASALDDLPRQARRFARWRAHRMGRGVHGGNNDAADMQGRNAGRSLRVSPLRPGRPPGWRRRPDHQVYAVLNELHGLAVWATARPDTS
jgi:hypothetical protein